MLLIKIFIKTKTHTTSSKYSQNSLFGCWISEVFLRNRLLCLKATSRENAKHWCCILEEFDLINVWAHVEISVLASRCLYVDKSLHSLRSCQDLLWNSGGDTCEMTQVFSSGQKSGTHYIQASLINLDLSGCQRKTMTILEDLMFDFLSFILFIFLLITL